MITIQPEHVLMVVGGAASITTAIFWGAWYLGRLGNRVEWLRERVVDHELVLREIGRRRDDPHV